MSGKRQAVYLFLGLVLIASAAALGYTAGRASTEIQRIREPQEILPQLVNSSAVIRSSLLLNSSVFLTFSLDKPVYSPGETIHIKGTLTNLTPRETTLQLWVPRIIVSNGSKTVWTYPEFTIVELEGPILRGPDEPIPVPLRPGETSTIDVLTRSWNQTGIQIESAVAPGYSEARVVYDDHPVPEGRYLINWIGVVGLGDASQHFNETAIFEIMKTTSISTTATCPTTTTSTVTKTSTTTNAVVITMETTKTEKTNEFESSIYTWAIGATVIATVFAVIILRKK